MSIEKGTVVERLVFSEPLTLLKTDLLEIDYKRKIAYVTNNAGMVKSKSRFATQTKGDVAWVDD